MTSRDAYSGFRGLGVSCSVGLDIVDFFAIPPVAEMGATVSTVALYWEFNRDVETVLINGAEWNGFSVYTGPFTAETEWTLKGTVGDLSKSARTSLLFQNRAYWGKTTSAPATSLAIRALENNAFITTRTDHRISTYCTGTDRPVFCYPVRLGEIKSVEVLVPVAAVPGATEWVDFTDLTTTTVADFTNSSGFSEDYYVTIFDTLPREGYFEVRWR